MVHQKKPQRMLRLFCCTIPSGTDSHFAQALVFVSRALKTPHWGVFARRTGGGPELFSSPDGAPD